MSAKGEIHLEPCPFCKSAAGNAAAMREALVGIRALIADEPDGTPMIDAMRATIDAAFAAPPRNCDRFADELDAQLAFLNEVWLISVDRESMLERDRYENWTDEMRARYGQWLLAPRRTGGSAS